MQLDNVGCEVVVLLGYRDLTFSFAQVLPKIINRKILSTLSLNSGSYIREICNPHKLITLSWEIDNKIWDWKLSLIRNHVDVQKL